MAHYEQVQQELLQHQYTWLVTGVAGFIGSNLLEKLLMLNQNVVGLDNFSTGYQHNLDEVQSIVTSKQWSNFHFIEGDIRNLDDCSRAMQWKGMLISDASPLEIQYEGVDFVLHQAALGSVPRSIKDPITTNQNNIDGFLNMLVAARDAGVGGFVYAASSSTYGDHPDLPKVEDKIGKPLSPYAVTKVVNELYADVFAKTYGFKSIGLRYFNIFGQRQNPNGAYAAVIPKWIAAMIKNEPVYINGDGETSRDFCYIENAVQANLLAAMVTATPVQTENQKSKDGSAGQVYNVAVGNRISLNQLYESIRRNLATNNIMYQQAPVYRDFRAGDVRHSLAEIEKARQLLGYVPSHNVDEGLAEAMDWYMAELCL